jgi:hypothetical protein
MHLLDLPPELLAMTLALLPSIKTIRYVCRALRDVVAACRDMVSWPSHESCGDADQLGSTTTDLSFVANLILCRVSDSPAISRRDLVAVHAKFCNVLSVKVTSPIAELDSVTAARIRSVSRVTRLTMGRAQDVSYAVCHPHLRTLSLRFHRLVDDLPLAVVLEAAPHLVTLVIDGAANDAIVSGLSDVAAGVTFNSLRVLRIVHVPLCRDVDSDEDSNSDDEDAIDPSAVTIDWAQLARLFPRLKTLAVSMARHVIRDPVALPHLTTLYVGNGCPAELWTRLQLPSLTSLKACKTGLLSTEALLTTLAGGRWPQLRALTVYDDHECRPSCWDIDWTAAAAAVPYLTTLTVAGPCVPSWLVATFVTQLAHLTSVDVMAYTYPHRLLADLDGIVWSSIKTKRLTGVVVRQISRVNEDVVEPLLVFTERGISRCSQPWSMHDEVEATFCRW